MSSVDARFRLERLGQAPWLAALLSGILPGLGQAYVGGVASAGLVGSVTYVGSILDAAQAATPFNQTHRRSAEVRLERELFPELFP